jgi:hypothetical protein
VRGVKPEERDKAITLIREVIEMSKHDNFSTLRTIEAAIALVLNYKARK